MKSSAIFTNAEFKSLNERLEGSKKDPTGIFASRVKPKLKELLIWFKIKKKINEMSEDNKRIESNPQQKSLDFGRRF